jgi:ABC-type multidrug transport system ATPase subunit
MFFLLLFFFCQVGSPSVLFLDEPTSGLDATASNDILK